MKKFNQGRDRNFSDRGSSHRRPERGSFGGENQRDNSMMHSAVCFECGKDCQVPFKPSGSKPVFCSICFGSKQDSERRSDDKFARNSSFKPRFDNDQKKPVNNLKMDEIISRLDKIIKLLSPVLELKKDEAQVTKVDKIKKEATKVSSKTKSTPKKKTTKAKK
jgi:CxxC-x17-CxxC domain-containing protein